MIETKVLLIGSIIQFILYIRIGIQKGQYKIPAKVLLISIISYLVIGIMMTFLNVNSNIDLGECGTTCGTKSFNPLTIISFFGNLINMGIFGLSSLFLIFYQKIKM